MVIDDEHPDRTLSGAERYPAPDHHAPTATPSTRTTPTRMSTRTARTPSSGVHTLPADSPMHGSPKASSPEIRKAPASPMSRTDNTAAREPNRLGSPPRPHARTRPAFRPRSPARPGGPALAPRPHTQGEVGPPTAVLGAQHPLRPGHPRGSVLRLGSPQLAAVRAAAGARVVSMLLAMPAFFVDGIPGPSCICSGRLRARHDRHRRTDARPRLAPADAR